MTDKSSSPAPTGTPEKSLGRSPWVYVGLMLAAYGVIAALATTGAVEGAAIYILVIAPFGLIFPMMAAANRRVDQGGASCFGKGAAQRRYKWRVAMFSSLYLVVLGLMTFVLKSGDPHPAIRTILALLPGLAVVGIFWSVGRLIVEEQDEFLRMLVIRQSLIATGVALSAATVWGFLENADVAPHLDAYWWAIAWFFGIGVGAIANRIQYGTWGTV